MKKIYKAVLLAGLVLSSVSVDARVRHTNDSHNRMSGMVNADGYIKCSRPFDLGCRVQKLNTSTTPPTYEYTKVSFKKYLHQEYPNATMVGLTIDTEYTNVYIYFTMSDKDIKEVIQKDADLY